PVRASPGALPDRTAGHHRCGRRRTAGPGHLDREAVLLPAGGGHRRFRTGARRDGGPVRARRERRRGFGTGAVPTLVATRLSGPRHRNRRRLNVHPAQHHRRTHTRHAQELRSNVTGYQWNPSDDYIEGANVTRLARSHGLAGIDELRARSVADTAWFW